MCVCLFSLWHLCVWGGGGRDHYPLILKLFLFSLIYFSFFSLFRPREAAASTSVESLSPPSSPLCFLTKLPNFLELVFMYRYKPIIQKKIWQLCVYVCVCVCARLYLLSPSLLLSIQGYIYFYDCKEKK